MKQSLVTIQSGWAKGMPLVTPPGLKTRPTASRVREAVFSLLANDIVASTFLDLFAGSGAMGMEAISRGAHKAIFVDSDPLAFKCLNQNMREIMRRALVQELDPPSIQLLNHDVLGGSWTVWGGGSAGKSIGASIEIAYLDPPYDLVEKSAQRLLELLHPVMCPHGMIVFESRSGKDAAFVKNLVDSSEGFRWLKSKAYGQVGITVFQRVESRLESTQGK